MLSGRKRCRLRPRNWECWHACGRSGANGPRGPFCPVRRAVWLFSPTVTRQLLISNAVDLPEKVIKSEMEAPYGLSFQNSASPDPTAAQVHGLFYLGRTTLDCRSNKTFGLVGPRQVMLRGSFSCPLPRAIKESLVLRASSRWLGEPGRSGE